MSKGGYDKFFKDARDLKREGAKAGGVKRAPAGLDSVKFGKDRDQGRQNPRLGKPPFPIKAVAGMIFCAGIGIFYLAHPETIEKWIDKVEIRAMGQARAAEGEKAAESAVAGKKPGAKDAAPDPGPDAAKAAGSEASVAEEPSHFEKLRQRKEELDRREKELGELEEELQKQKVELDKRIATLEDLRTSVAQILKDRVEMDQEKVTKLVDLYANMKPKQAADIIGTLNEELVVEVLAKMKKKNAAEVMNLLPAEKARVLSEKYTGYRRKATAANDKN